MHCIHLNFVTIRDCSVYTKRLLFRGDTIIERISRVEVVDITAMGVDLERTRGRLLDAADAKFEVFFLC